VFIVFFNPRTIGAGTHGGDPLGVVQIPAHRVAQAFVKANRLLPAELVLELGAIDGIAAVVAGPVFDVRDKRLELPHGLAGLFGDNFDKPVKQPDVLPFVFAADVVGAARGAVLHDGPDCFVVVFDIEPVSDVPPVAVDRKGLAFEHVEDHEGDELFRELIGPVVVGAVGEGEREPIGMVVGLGEVIACRLAGRIGRAGVVGGFFGKIAFIAQRAEDLIGAYMMEEHVLAQRAIRVFPGIASDIEEGVGTHDIGAHKGFGAEDGPVHMAFRGKVHDGVDAVFGKDALNEGAVADVTFYKKVPALAARFSRKLPIARLDIGKVFKVARIGQGVKVDDSSCKIVLGKEPVDEVGTDKTGAAGD